MGKVFLGGGAIEGESAVVLVGCAKLFGIVRRILAE